MIDTTERSTSPPVTDKRTGRSSTQVAAVNPPMPIQPGQRLPIIDIVRGFAIFGILLVNMALFTNSIYTLVVGVGSSEGILDRLALWGITFFAEGKFYSTFAFLFGLGLAMQYRRFQEAGQRFVPFYLRRMAVLLLIGLIHAYLFWVGDILILYSVLGVALLLLFRNRQPRTLVIWAGVLLLIPILINAALVGLVELGRQAGGQQLVDQALAEQTRQYQMLGTQADRVYATGGFAEITGQRVRDMAFIYTTWPFMGFNVLAMMVLGLAAGKRRIVEDLQQHLPLVRRVWRWGLVAGVIGNLLYVVAGETVIRSLPSWQLVAALVGQTIGAPALSLCYMCTLALLAQRRPWQRRLAPLANVGRMAISNYLLQTVICTTLFYGYGFGLYGQIGVAGGVLLSVAIFALQIPLSAWWLRRFRFGPVEWLWRSLTYGRRQPMRQPLLAGV